MKRKAYEIIYEDENIIAVNKSREVFSVATDDIKTRRANLLFYLQMYLRKKNEECFIVHRLDYETSGVMVFAKNIRYKTLLQKQFENREVERRYEAVIKEKIPINTQFRFIDEINGKKSITFVKAIDYINIGTALDIKIETGRHNQIRIALKNRNLTLLGDKRFSKDIAKRLYLNSYLLAFKEELELNKNRFEVQPLWIRREDGED